MPNSSYPLLQSINDPADLRRLPRPKLDQLAAELRAFLLGSVARTGGHLSSNLGTVELTIALHYVFNTPQDRVVWDVGHQTYPHKILTGRRDRMDSLRQWGGLSGFPQRTESDYDTFGTAHSSTSISAALGCALPGKAVGLCGRPCCSGQSCHVQCTARDRRATLGLVRAPLAVPISSASVDYSPSVTERAHVPSEAYTGAAAAPLDPLRDLRLPRGCFVESAFATLPLADSVQPFAVGT